MGRWVHWIIANPEVLRDKLGPAGARALAELFNEASVRTRDDVIELASGAPLSHF